VTEAEFKGLPAEVRDHEPTGALVAGPTGRESLEHLLAGGLGWLEPGGALVLELAPGQAGPLRDSAEAAGYEAVAVHPDLAGRDRVLVARRPVSEAETAEPPRVGRPVSEPAPPLQAGHSISGEDGS
jgi:release factor glutamine methyltransferase